MHTAAHPVYTPLHPARSSTVTVRGLQHHVLNWGDVSQATPEQPLLVLMHGWMDVAASFQFMVDALRQRPGWDERPIVAIDWRGFGRTDSPATDSYFFADYVADLDGLLDALSPEQPVDLLGHSMGGNIVMLYAGARPERVRRLVNLEGFGLPATSPDESPERYAKWLNALKEPVRMVDYARIEDVAKRLQQNNPRLQDEKANWLAQHWARLENGRWVINADPVHKRPNPLLYRVEEVNAFFKRITAPLLFVDGDETVAFKFFFAGKYGREEFLQRMALVSDFRLKTLTQAGHMLHHDQPEALAGFLSTFLDSPGGGGA